MAYTSANEYLKVLEEILKKNKGSRVNTLYDTASNVPDQLQLASPLVKKQQDLAMVPDSIDQMQYDVPQARPITQPNGQVQGASTNTQSFLEQLGQVYFSPEVQQQTQDQPQEQKPIVDSEGGYLGIDNKFYYEDGTVRESSDPSAYAIGSTPDGGYLYSDGKIRRPRRDDEMMSVPPYIPEYPTMSVANGKYANRQGDVFSGSVGKGKPINSFNEYLSLLSGGRLGEQDVTGGYGEYYGFPREPYNIGTDIGTGKLGGNQVNISLPFNAEVVEVGHWDGRNANSTSTPYGNSVLVKLPTGHMIRFSHLSELGKLSVGDKIAPGTSLGVTGDTGHAFGKHLDHEMYSPEGGLISSEQFFSTLQSQPEVAKLLTGSSGFQIGDMISQGNKGTNQTTYPIQSSPSISEPVSQPNVFQNPPNQPNVFQNASTSAADFIDKVKPTGDYGGGLTELARGDLRGAGKEIGGTIEKLNPTGSLDLGISEMFSGKPQLAQEKQRQTAQNVGNTVGNIGKATGLPEMGVSEFISQLPNLFNKPVLAAEIGQPEPQQQQNVFQNALAQAGQGVSGLTSSLGDALGNIFKKKELANIGNKNVIGEDTGGAIASNLGDIKSSSGGNAPNNQAAFFKGGGFDIYRDQLNPEVTKGYRGALDPSLFKSTFFENPDNVANVFGNTAMGKDATGKYKSYMSTQYPIKPGGESPTIKKSEKYLSSYDGLYDNDQYWRDAFSARGQDVNSSAGKGYQQREQQNMKDWTWEEQNPIYYENQYNKSVLDSIPEVLQSDFSFKAPRNSGNAMMSTPPQGLYQPVKGDATAKEDYSKARSIPQIPSSNVFTPKGQLQSVPSVLGASVSRAPTPRPTPPIMSKPAPPQANASYNGQSVYNPPVASRPSAPSAPASRPSAAPTPAPTPAPRPSYSAPAPSRPSYTPPAPSRPAPAPRPAPTPAPRPAPRPAPAPAPRPQTNVFQNLINYLFGRR